MIMKFMKSILAVGLVMVAVATASAQVDYFAFPKTIIVPPKLITATDSNSVVDIHGFEGIAKIDVLINGVGGATTTLTIYNSPDRTNWTALANYALATNTVVTVTNNYYGTSGQLLATNTFALPGVSTTPVAATSGFTTPYIATNPFTNSGAITIANAAVEVGFNASDAQHYLQFLWTVTSGTNPTNTVCAIITGRKQQYP